MGAAQFNSLSDQDFYPYLAEQPGVSIVFFTKQGCSSCRAWRQLLAELQQVDNNVRVFEVDAAINSALTQEYAIYHLPALFVFVNGQFHAPLQCEARLSAVQAMLKHVLAAPPTEAP